MHKHRGTTSHQTTSLSRVGGELNEKQSTVRCCCVAARGCECEVIVRVASISGDWASSALASAVVTSCRSLTFCVLAGFFPEDIL
jgi:hypothetical protein